MKRIALITIITISACNNAPASLRGHSHVSPSAPSESELSALRKTYPTQIAARLTKQFGYDTYAELSNSPADSLNTGLFLYGDRFTSANAGEVVSSCKELGFKHLYFYHLHHINHLPVFVLDTVIN